MWYIVLFLFWKAPPGNVSIHYPELDCEKESLRGGIRKFLQERSVLTFADDSKAVKAWSV